MQDYSRLQQLISDDLAQVDPEAVASAAARCEQLPPPAAGYDALAAQCLFQTAFAAEQLQQFSAAEELYTKALKYPASDPHASANLHYHLGICLEGQAKLESAIRHFRIAVSEAVDWPVVRQLARFHTAHLLMLCGDYHTAAAEFSVLCEQDPCAELSDLDLRLRRLTCVLRAGGGKPQLADPVIGSMEQLPPAVTPGTVQLVFDLALAAEDRSAYELSERLYRAVIASPNAPPQFHANAWFRLGLVLDLRGHWSGTEDSYRRALRHPHAWPALQDLARFHLANFLMTVESFEEAADLFSEHAEKATSSVLPLTELRLREAICRFRADDDKAAERILQSLRETHGDSIPAVEQWMADIYESRKDYKSAAACYQKLIQHPGSEVTLKAAALQRLNTIHGLH